MNTATGEGRDYKDTVKAFSEQLREDKKGIEEQMVAFTQFPLHP